MTDEHYQTPAAASIPESPTPVAAAPTPAGSSAASDSPAPAGVFDGAWFRRERERIAVGRRAIAKHLQVAESRVIALETKGQLVPVPWLPLVAALGFRLLPQLSEQTAMGAAAPSPASDEPAPAIAPAAAAVAPPAELSASAAAAVASSSDAEPPVAPAPLPDAPAASPARARAAAEPRPRIDGAWLLAERERLGMSRNTLRLLLNIHWATCARVEKQGLPIPKRFWPKLKDLGFHFAIPAPAAVSPAAPAPAAPAAPAPATPLRGAWLRRERKRLGLSDRQVWQAVQAHWRTVIAVERGNRAIPAAWLPALQQLGMLVPGAKEEPSRPRGKAAERTAAESATAAAEPKKAPPAAAPPAAEPTDSPRELLAMIVNYRLKLGRRSGQSAVETLGLIAQDLRTANLGQVVSHDQLAQALDCLLRAG